jgi:hypothetical protein
MKNPMQAEQVCNDTTTVWSWQQEAVEEAFNYNDHARIMFLQMKQGHLFGTLALTLWVCIVAGHLRSTFNFGLLTLLNADAMRDIQDAWKEKFADRRKACKLLDSMNFGMGSRLIIFVVTGVRSLLLLTIGFRGAAFISHTRTLKEFLLDCVALAFVFDIPKYLHDAFGHWETKQAMHKTNNAFEVLRVRVKLERCFSFLLFLTFCALSFAIFAYGFYELHRAQQAEAALLRGVCPDSNTAQQQAFEHLFGVELGGAGD